MNHPDGTPMTLAESTNECARRWAWIEQRQRSAHPISPQALSLFQQYAEGKISTVLALIHKMHQHFDKRRFPEGPDGPEIFEPSNSTMTSAQGPEQYIETTGSSLSAGQHAEMREATQEEELSWLIERSTQPGQSDGES